MPYDAYKIGLSIAPANSTEAFKEQLQQISNTGFDTGINIYTIKHRNRITLDYSEVEVKLSKPYNLAKSNTIKDDYFKVLFRDINYPVYLGDIFEFDNYYWIVVDANTNKTINNSVLIRRCSVKLNFTASTPISENIISVYGFADTKLLNNDQNNMVVLPEKQKEIFVPFDDNSRKIKCGSLATRFIIGQQAWKVIGIDGDTYVRRTICDPLIEFGLLKLRLELTQLNPSVDNLTLGVAWQDYFKR